MTFILGAVAGAVCTLAIIGLHRLITYGRWKEGFWQGYDRAWEHIDKACDVITVKEKEDKDE